MKLIITRHGECIGNVNKVFQGNSHLSKQGIIQAKKLAKRLKKETFDIIFSSDLFRAKETAKEILKYHKKVPIIFTKELRERDVKSFVGKKIEEVDQKILWKSIESNKQIQKRAKNFLNKIFKNNIDKSVLIVAHADMNKAVITLILDKDPSFMNFFEQKNTAVNIFTINEDKKHKIHLINCTKHLN